MNGRFSMRVAIACLVVRATLGVAWAQPVPDTPLPPPRLELVLRGAAPEARLPVRLDAMSVRAELAGSVATTEVELTFFNPNDRVLEGELRFPLLEGQTVTGFALDVEGAMRQAVPVPKDKGRQVFDDVARQRVDPALLQVTQGHNYSLRVYPIAALATRRVRLQITQGLDRARDALVYRLPIGFAGVIGRLDATVGVNGVRGADAVVARLGTGAAPAVRDDGAGRVVVTHSALAYEGGGVLEVRRAPLAGVQAGTQEYRGRTYFYAELPADRGVRAARPVPRRLGIVWDASGSARQAAHRQLDLLAEYFKRVRHTEVMLSVVRDVAQPVQSYPIRDGNWDALRRRLEALVYDGGTSAHLLAQAAPGVDQVLIFSDGLLNFGRAEAVAPRVPTMTLSATASADAALLRHTAERSGGEYVDLARTTPRDAVQRLTGRRPRIVAIQGRGATDFVMHSPYATDGAYRIGGTLDGDAATVCVTIEDAGGARHSVTFALAAAPQADRGIGVAVAQWAAMKLAQLQAEPGLNAAAIERLGLHMRMVTPRTSLIVLDTARDYARYEIEPPAEDTALLRAYQDLRARAHRAEQAERERQLARVAREFESRRRWWLQDFPKDTPAALAGPGRQPDARGVAATLEQRPEPAPARAAPPPAAPAAAAPPPAAQMVRKDATAEAASAAPAAAAAIRLKKWAPDSRYARRMRAAQGDEVYRVYLDERPGNLDSTAFFLDAADILAEKRQPDLAARVLSNLAEMDLENRQILRILAYRLTQLNAHAPALAALERVLAIAPDEPQSWRDLALALASAGQYQAAIDHLWHVVSTPWHGRFPNIEIVALTELDAIVAQAAAQHVSVDTSAIAPALLQHMPLGLRVTLAWDADNTDIDLHVIDPNGEEAYYGHRLTTQGGAMSPDFTGGYGPEEFALRTPMPGRYRVRAHFYGHNQQIVAPSTTLMMDLYTDYGTPRQKAQKVVLRLSGRGETVDVGEFEVGEGGR